jgi:amidase
MSWNDVLSATALEQATLVRTRAVSSEELVRLYLGRIDALDGALHAFVTTSYRGALRSAQEKDAAVRRGEALPLFHGVPIGIKDLNAVRGWRTRFGSRGSVPLPSPLDDRTTAAVRRGGFVIVGKTATSEVGAMPVTEPDVHPPTRNPWKLEHTPGGSSDGAASAVAGGLLPIAQGSDGGGSIRLPSSFCHLYGLKPSRGRVPDAFGRPDRNVLYTSGPIARDVADAAALLDVLAGLDIGAPHWAPAPERPFRESYREAPPRVRVRFTTRASLGVTDPEVAEAVRAAARRLAEAGHDVEEGELPHTALEEFLPLWQHLVASVPLIRWSQAQPITRWLAEAGRKWTPDLVLARQRQLAARYLECFKDAELWLTPAAPVPAPRVGAFASGPPAETFARAAELGAFTAIFNVTGQPAASVPLGLTRGGLPMGLQVAGRPLADELVLRVSRQLEELAPWRGRRSPLLGPALNESA